MPYLPLIAWDKETNTAIEPERPPVGLEWARFPNGGKKQYPEPVATPVATPVPEDITVTDIKGAATTSADKTAATCYELTPITMTGTLNVSDQTFTMPVKSGSGETYFFLASVVNGIFTVVLDFPYNGLFSYSNAEANLDLQYQMFNVATVTFKVLRKIG